MTDIEAARAPDLARHVDRIRQIPTRYRSFAKPARHARNVHALTAEQLSAAVEHGLPVLGAGDDALYDDRDLSNLSAALGRRSAWYLGQLGFKAALDRLRSGGSLTFDVTCRPQCPYPGHPGPCDFRLLLADGDPGAEQNGHRSAEQDEHPGAEQDEHPSAGAVGRLTGPQTIRVRTSGAGTMAPPEVRAVLAGLAETEYLHLPPPLTTDLGFFDRTNTANCMLATAAIFRAARQAGLPVRTSFGLLLAPPFAGLHTWAEFLVDGRWTAFDPLLIALMEKARVLPPGYWPAGASLSGLLLRFAPFNAAVGRHGGNQTHVSYTLKKAE